MKFDIELYREGDEGWDDYVAKSKSTTFFHQIAYQRVITESFGFKPYYLAARAGGEIIGILPLFLVKSLIFGSSLVSSPFCDYGGICADGEAVQRALLEKAVEIGQKERVKYIELRHKYPTELTLPQSTEKVNLRVPLAPEMEIWAGFNAKLRNHVRKAQRSGLQFEVSNSEKLQCFYDVFAVHMRDMGTPVQSLSFFNNLLQIFPTAELLLITHERRIIGGGIAVYFKDSMELPWACSLRSYFIYCPNDLLYWEAIRRGCQQGLRYFNFGRSSKESGTYFFKKQWGAEDEQLFYQYAPIRSDKIPYRSSTNPKYKLFSKVWRRLPLSMANLIGSRLSRHVLY
jgi:FemAB-related protein (PEP-CTERM system-associated)